jgi:uncharacterized protein YgfB (UPF0149 family)
MRIKMIVALATLPVSLAMAASPAEAKGCIRGAVAGGVAGHYAHHHAVMAIITTSTRPARRWSATSSGGTSPGASAP